MSWFIISNDFIVDIKVNGNLIFFKLIRIDTTL